MPIMIILIVLNISIVVDEIPVEHYENLFKGSYKRDLEYIKSKIKKKVKTPKKQYIINNA